MKISSPLKSGIYEVSFRYNTNLGGYTTLMSDIPKLSEIGGKRLITDNRIRTKSDKMSSRYEPHGLMASIEISLMKTLKALWRN
jgi:hypothetical protein